MALIYAGMQIDVAFARVVACRDRALLYERPHTKSYSWVPRGMFRESTSSGL